jgi:hypothetical protein
MVDTSNEVSTAFGVRNKYENNSGQSVSRWRFRDGAAQVG